MIKILRKPTTQQARKGVAVLISVVVGLGIFGLGFGLGNKNFILRTNGIPEVVNTSIGKPADVDFSLFWKVFDSVESQYAGGTVDRQKLVYGAIRGMVAGLGDPYSLFLTPDEQKAFFESLNGSFQGIGAEVGLKDDKVIVVAPLDASPAQKAGIKAGDEIVSVDKKSVSGQSLNDVVTEIRGVKGTTVTLGIIDGKATVPHDVAIERDDIKVSSVATKVRDDGIGVLRISQFGADTSADAQKGAQLFVNKKVKGIVLDLRSNPGGFLNAAVDIGSLWIPDGSIVSEKPKDGVGQTYKATGNALLKDIPTAVLVDAGSASASEIVAGALQDTGKGRLFGVKTFGKGSVQNVSSLKDDSALRLTIAKWYTPKGRSINHEGIVPDEVIETPAQTDTSKPASDPVMDRAIEWLTKGK